MALNKNVLYAGGGMAMLLTGSKVSALSLFAKGVWGLEQTWREKHPNVAPGLKARWAESIRFYDATHQNAWNVTIRNMTVSGTHQAVEIWDSTIRNLTIEGARITNARDHAVRYELGSAITLKDNVSSGSGGSGFYSSKGSTPSGVTFINNSFR